MMSVYTHNLNGKHLLAPIRLTEYFISSSSLSSHHHPSQHNQPLTINGGRHLKSHSAQKLMYSAKSGENTEKPIDVDNLENESDKEFDKSVESDITSVTSEINLDVESTMATHEEPEGAVPTWRPKRENCTPPAIEQFPRPLMSKWLRQHGGLVIHVLVAIFTFFGLAIVCDEYFVASLDRLCEELKLSPDVAGATFMAAGSSAPELATVVIGVFFAKDDIGISGVIGSAVFNIMFVISVCALCSGTVCQLNWWPLVRDCFFYCISILVMLIIIFNDVISCVSKNIPF
ncbi:hypothetical protein DOY81_010693 [Sarcophaga bullata]|nr:hypothetical protein DOY81_010693 [Sarcophaga bullata]